MSDNTSEVNHASTSGTKYKGVRQRKWGKWVSEIRVPGTQDRLWLGTYKTPEGAAVAHDTAYYYLRRPSCMDKLNFPLMIPSDALQAPTSPGSIQRTASDAGMAIDAHLIEKMHENGNAGTVFLGSNGGEFQGNSDHGAYQEESLNISVEDYF